MRKEERKCFDRLHKLLRIGEIPSWKLMLRTTLPDDILSHVHSFVGVSLFDILRTFVKEERRGYGRENTRKYAEVGEHLEIRYLVKAQEWLWGRHMNRHYYGKGHYIRMLHDRMKYVMSLPFKFKLGRPAF